MNPPPLVVKHRCNTIASLNATDPELGVEIDLRSDGSDLILAHDPFSQGERFEQWLQCYRHGFIILNVKEEGLETAILGVLAKRGIEQFFFLDQSFPFLLKTANQGERRCAVRLSEFESIDTALALAGMVDWVWIDSFTRLPLDGEQARALQDAGFRLCLVSPELVGRTGPEALRDLRLELDNGSIALDAVCTKLPDLWRGAGTVTES